MTDLLMHLKAATQACHDKLEAGGVFSQLVQPDLTPAEYRHALYVMLRFHQALEPVLVSRLSSEDLDCVGFEPLLPYLVGDLGGWAEHEATTTLSLPNASQALGGLYVVMGSSLGAKLILRQLLANKRLMLSGATFGYYQRLAGRAQSWNHFKRQFEAIFHHGGGCQAELVQGAQSCFQYLLLEVERLPSTVCAVS